MTTEADKQKARESLAGAIPGWRNMHEEDQRAFLNAAAAYGRQRYREGLEVSLKIASEDCEVFDGNSSCHESIKQRIRALLAEIDREEAAALQEGERQP